MKPAWEEPKTAEEWWEEIAQYPWQIVLDQIRSARDAEYEAAVIKRVARLYRGVTLPVLGNVMVAIKSLREEM